MTTVQAGLTYYKQVNEQIRAAQDSEITVENVIGQRYIGCGSTDRKITCLLYTSPSPRDGLLSRMPSSA